jgi:gas vesicle protein
MSNTFNMRRNRSSRKRFGGIFGAGTLIGAVLGRLFDPVSGKRRRAELRDRTAAFFRRSGRKAARVGRYTGSYAHGLKQRATHLREQPKDLDDATLADKIETKIFRPADVPKGQINVNVQQGLVQLRGEVPRTEMIDDLEKQVRAIQGVRDVENLLHVPGVEPQMHQ